MVYILFGYVQLDFVRFCTFLFCLSLVFTCFVSIAYCFVVKKYIRKTHTGIYKKYGKHIKKADKLIFIDYNSYIFDKPNALLLY
jgi:hypothetical protein